MAEWRLPLDPDCPDAWEGVLAITNCATDDEEEDHTDSKLVEFAVRHRQTCDRCRGYADVQRTE